MATQFSRAIIGACVVVSFAALVLPQFFNEKTECGCANCNGSVCADLKSVSMQDKDMTTGIVDEEGGNNLDGASEVASTAEGEHEIVPAEPMLNDDDGGYAALLEEEGAQAPAEINDSGRSGVVVGVRTDNNQNNNFVSNPVATGTSPADAARIRAEKAREAAELRKAQEAERAQAVLEAKKQEAAKREAQRKLEAERLEANRKAQLEAQKKQQEAERLAAIEAQKKADAFLKKQEQALNVAPKKTEPEIKNLTQVSQAKQPAVPAGHYLQLGVFTNLDNAQKARSGKKFSMSRQDLQKAGAGFGFKIDDKSSPGKYILLLGPSKSDEVLQNLKAKNFNGSFIVNR